MRDPAYHTPSIVAGRCDVCESICERYCHIQLPIGKNTVIPHGVWSALCRCVCSVCWSGRRSRPLQTTPPSSVLLYAKSRSPNRSLPETVDLNSGGNIGPRPRTQAEYDPRRGRSEYTPTQRPPKLSANLGSIRKVDSGLMVRVSYVSKTQQQHTSTQCTD